jgi:hypothetical protein
MNEFISTMGPTVVNNFLYGLPLWALLINHFMLFSSLVPFLHLKKKGGGGGGLISHRPRSGR